MSIKQTVNTALSAVLANTYAVELPTNPTWPAMVFEIDSVAEKSWVLGGGYDQHAVTISILSRSLTELGTLTVQADAAMLALSGYLDEGDRGDGSYEADPSLYVYVINHTIRTPRY